MERLRDYFRKNTVNIFMFLFLLLSFISYGVVGLFWTLIPVFIAYATGWIKV